MKSPKYLAGNSQKSWPKFSEVFVNIAKKKNSIYLENSRNVSHFRLKNKPILNFLGQIFPNFQNFLEAVEAVRCRRNDGWSIEVVFFFLFNNFLFVYIQKKNIQKKVHNHLH